MCQEQTFPCQKLSECQWRILRTSTKHAFCEFGLFQHLNNPIVPNKIAYIKIIFKLTNDCHEESFFIVLLVGSINLVTTFYMRTSFLHVIYSILNTSSILKKNKNLLARNETSLAGNENCLERNETRLARNKTPLVRNKIPLAKNKTRDGNLHLSSTVSEIKKIVNSYSFSCMH